VWIQRPPGLNGVSSTNCWDTLGVSWELCFAICWIARCRVSIQGIVASVSESRDGATATCGVAGKNSEKPPFSVEFMAVFTAPLNLAAWYRTAMQSACSGDCSIR